jgi:hypothetical protein
MLEHRDGQVRLLPYGPTKALFGIHSCPPVGKPGQVDVVNEHCNLSVNTLIGLKVDLLEAAFDVDVFQELHVCHNLSSISEQFQSSAFEPSAGAGAMPTAASVDTRLVNCVSTCARGIQEDGTQGLATGINSASPVRYAAAAVLRGIDSLMRTASRINRIGDLTLESIRRNRLDSSSDKESETVVKGESYQILKMRVETIETEVRDGTLCDDNSCPRNLCIST